MAHTIEALREHGQSVWLDYIRRGLITSGELERMIRDGWITGVTSNPTIFQKAIAGSEDYDDAMRAIHQRGECSAYEGFLELGGDDIRMAADALRPVYDRTDRADGYVSFEAQEADVAGTIDEVRRMWALVDRPNVMIKVPGTQAGIQAVAQLFAEGININITLLFDIDVYEQVANAYIAGLERRLEAGEPVDGIASVASFFVSRIDTKVDKQLPEGSPLRGKVAVANAVLAYKRFRKIFSGPRWQKLADAGARVQRPLWASTGTKNPEYPDTLYVEELVAADTVNTMPEATLRAFLNHGRARPAIEEQLETAERTLAQAADAGIDLKAITSQLLTDGLAAFGKDFDRLLAEIDKEIQAVPSGRPRHGGKLADLEARVDARLATFDVENVVERVWERDHTVWKPDPTEISNRLGWLSIVDTMIDATDELRSFAAGVRGDGYRHAVLLGMGGSSLAPEVLYKTFGARDGGLELKVLDTTDPASITAVEDEIDLQRTLFIVASKSGTTIETLSHFAYFWEKIPDGRHFIAITDRGSSLQELSRERGFRKAFANPADIGGRYSALSYFGLVPAALIGVDVDGLLDRAHEMVHACHPCVPSVESPGAWLGAVMGEGALAGRDKVTLVLPDAIGSLGTWIEQLIAESTGKEDRGILPVEGEALGLPDVYGDDRVFVAIGDHDGLAALEAAGHPVARLPYQDELQLGSEFFRWELATAVAGHVLQINAFDQPNVQDAKNATARILESDAAGEPESEALAAVLEQVGPGDYIALQAYLPRNDEIDTKLQVVRRKLRDRYRVATTVGYGPRFLHSTGQLHKGGPNTGVFIQIVGEDEVDLAIPGRPFTFGTLKRAQAQGDLESLQARGRRVARVTLDELQEV